MNVLYLSDVEEKNFQHLTNAMNEAINVVRLPRDAEDEAIERAAEFDAFIGSRAPREFLEAAKNLQYYIIPFAGVPKKDKKNLRDFPELHVINSHFNAHFVAEHAWALLLASTRKLCPIHEKMKGGDWRPRYHEKWRGIAMKGKTLLVLGYGHIGRKIAEIGKAFDMTVKAVKRTPEKTMKIDYLGTNDDLPSLLPEADFIVVTLPLTEQTKGFLGREEFEMMKEGVHIVNVGRGPVINEDAFYEALKSDKIGGAGIDTWWEYPSDEAARSNTAPSKHPLDEFEEVVFSPHRASLVQEFEKARMEDLARILNILARGEEVNVVDIEKGY